MDRLKFVIPKQTDESLVLALKEIREKLQDTYKLFIRLTPHNNAEAFDLNGKEPQNDARIQYVLAERSYIMPYLHLIDANSKKVALTIQRCSEKVTDEVFISLNEWVNYLPQEIKSKAFVKLVALARSQLRAFDTEAGISGLADTEWGRYRESQLAILNSLQEVQKSIVFEFSKRTLEAEVAAKAKFETLETGLRNELKLNEEQLKKEYENRLKAVEERELALKKREELFNTKEARYVARQEQKEQVTQIKDWIAGWSLTPGTTKKRWAVTSAYMVALIVTGGMTYWFTNASVEILKGGNISQLAWWQWSLISLKSLVPFAAFTSFIIYFIRWSSAWAKQHAEEEFRNRARMMDIGRSAWLLEAVRDAQDNQRELPPDLLKELSRNLFSHTSSNEGGELAPQAVTDLLMHGLSSIRVKTSDGSEVEATRGKKK